MYMDLDISSFTYTRFSFWNIDKIKLRVVVSEKLIMIRLGSIARGSKYYTTIDKLIYRISTIAAISF